MEKLEEVLNDKRCGLVMCRKKISLPLNNNLMKKNRSDADTQFTWMFSGIQVTARVFN